MAIRYTVSSADLLDSIVRGLVNPTNLGGSYNGTEIDYWSFRREPHTLDEDTAIRCEVTDGSEGTWVNVYALPNTPDRVRVYLGCVKSLECSESSWANMGALAGLISWRTEKALWQGYRDAVRAASASA